MTIEAVLADLAQSVMFWFNPAVYLDPFNLRIEDIPVTWFVIGWVQGLWFTRHRHTDFTDRDLRGVVADFFVRFGITFDVQESIGHRHGEA